MTTTVPGSWAVYVRMSTGDQVESPEVQLARAKQYAEKIGLTSEPIIYRDNALSRSEYKKRPALYSMINAASCESGPAYNTLIVRDVDRLGGDQSRNQLLLSELIDRGVVVHEYQTENVVKLDNALSKFMAAAKSFAAELEVEKVRARTHEILLDKAKRGLNVGGRCFGYQNVQIMEGDRRVRTEYRIDPEEAKLVRQIFRSYASGWGLKRIVRELNGKRIPSPQAAKRGTGSWSTSVIRPMLKRERYRGVLVWGRFEKTYKLGTKVRVKRDAKDADLIAVEAPHLKIVDDDLWFAVAARFSSHSRVGTDKGGNRPRYLLSGIGRCAECGGPIVASRTKYDGKHVYCCSYAKSRGESICTNTLRRPMEVINDYVVSWILEQISPEWIVKAITEIREARTKDTGANHDALAALRKEVGRLKRELARLVAALAASEDPPEAMMKAISERQTAAKEIDRQIATATAAPKAAAQELDALEDLLLNRVQSLRDALSKRPEEARALAAAIFPKLTFKPVKTKNGLRYEIVGEAVFGTLLVGLPGPRSPAGASPTGFEPVLAA